MSEEKGPAELLSGAWQRFQWNSGAKPLVGAVAAAGLVSALAVELGVAELALGAVTGYAVYRMLRYGIPLPEAFVEGLRLEEKARDELQGRI